MKHTSRISSSRCVRGSRPSTLSSPLKEVSPRIALRAVVLPAPFGPMSPTMRPASMWKLTPARACVAPKLLASPRASITAVIFFTLRGGGAALRRPRCGRRCGARALQFIRSQSQALDGGVDLGPLVLEEALALILQQRLACPGAHEHAQSAPLLHQLLVHELLVAFEHGEGIDPEIRGDIADRG